MLSLFATFPVWLTAVVWIWCLWTTARTGRFASRGEISKTLHRHYVKRFLWSTVALVVVVEGYLSADRWWLHNRSHPNTALEYLHYFLIAAFVVLFTLVLWFNGQRDKEKHGHLVYLLIAVCCAVSVTGSILIITTM